MRNTASFELNASRQQHIVAGHSDSRHLTPRWHDEREKTFQTQHY